MRIPKLRHHKGSGQALVEYQGQRHYLGKYGSEAADKRYAEFVRQFLDAPKDGAVKSPSGVSVADFVEAYFDWCQAYYRDANGRVTNEYSMMRYAMAPVLNECGDLKCGQFSPAHLKSVRNRMVGQGWSRRYINHQVQRVRRAFRWGVENGFVSGDVLAAIESVAPLKRNRTSARETAAIQPASDEHVNATMPFLSPTVRAMVELQRRSGMRPQNVCMLTPSQIDCSRDPWAYIPSDHKTSHAGRSLEIYLGPHAQSVLAPLLEKSTPDQFVFSPRRSAEEYRALRRRNLTRSARHGCAPRKSQQSRVPGDRYNSRSYRRAIFYGIRKANAAIATSLAEQLGRQPTEAELAERSIPHWHPHQLRHARGTEIRQQYGLEAAQVSLGHSRADVTQIYAKRDRELAEKVARETG